MDTGSILLFLTLFVLVLAYVVRPIIDHRSTGVSTTEQKISTLLANRDRVLDALQELDFDHQMGKIPEDKYPDQRADLLARGAVILKELDEIQGKDPQLKTQPPSENEQRHLKAPDDDLEKRIADRRRERSEKSAGFCPQCGLPLQASDKFCSKCGTVLNL